ncbi:DUF1441 family protein [Vibrio vulnificus]|uniref:DUF1441 family protein n=1 Tax=Vibrio vulnificus TaxID=672 RepID=UPI001A1E9572|nr:DUF1441 family protein [Vibrio vulnificus]MCJ0806661.1 DUF1441 family protein [Vibrio vulnificus]HAS6087746.1 DUF1441 family protein [Vibrio vulnificus]
MSNVSKISASFDWSISKMAEAFGMSRNTVSKRLREQSVQPAGQERGSLVYALKDAAPALFQSDPTTSGALLDPNKMPPEMRKAWFQSENERIKFEKSLGLLSETSDVARNYALLAKSVIQVMETMPDVLERDCGLTPSQVAKVQASIDDLRDQIAVMAALDVDEEDEVEC